MKVKKIAALAVGAAMIGATMGFASAQPTVPEIPKDFFVKDGQPNVKIVVGSSGAAQDVAGAADIAVAIGSILYTQKDVDEVTVIVKGEESEPVVDVDPNDIPVFFNYYPQSSLQEWKIGSTTGAKVHGWWNGAYIDYHYREGEWWADSYADVRADIGDQFDFNATSSYWDGGEFTIEESKNVAWDVYPPWAPVYVDPFNFTVPGAISIKLDEPAKATKDGKTFTFEEGDIVDYHVTIEKFELENYDAVLTSDDISALSDLRVAIPAGAVDVTMNFAVAVGKYQYSVDCMYCSNCPSDFVGYYDYNGAGATQDETYIYGIGPGDTVNLFDKEITIVGVNKNIKNFGDYTGGFVYGTPYDPMFVNTEAPTEFGHYRVEILDIDINSEKALIQVTDLDTGVTEKTTLYAADVSGVEEDSTYDVLFDGGLYLKLESVFVGIGGTTAAKIEVATDLHGVKVGSQLLPGWKVTDLNIIQDPKDSDRYIITDLALTNAEKLEGNINLFDQFTITYNYDIDTGSCKRTDAAGTTYTCKTGTFGVAAAWVDFDPLYVTTETTEEVTGEADLTTVVPGDVTQPITVLDTEIMEAGLDSVDSNLILVGGPVVNKVTAALAETLGVPADYDGWKEQFGTGAESGVIKYVAEVAEINNYGVVLVAGTDREGTKAAAEALMEYIAGL